MKIWRQGPKAGTTFAYYRLLIEGALNWATRQKNLEEENAAAQFKYIKAVFSVLNRGSGFVYNIVAELFRRRSAPLPFYGEKSQTCLAGLIAIIRQ